MSGELAALQTLAEAVQENTAYLKELREDKEDITKAPAGTGTGTMLHGPTGIFSGPGLERDVITAHVRPMGIASILPHIPSVSMNPYFASLTGYTEANGTAEPTNACDEAPAGFVKGCNLTARFGLARRDTQTIEMDDVMRVVNRGDFTDLILRGQVLGLVDNLSPSGLNPSQILNIVTMSEMVGVGVQIERLLSTRYWTGSAALGQMPGLDNQIATGQVDAQTNTTCPALDSDVKSFAYNDVCGTGLDIVEYLEAMAYYLEWNAMSMGLDPVKFAIAMRPPLWQVLTECYPCLYNLNARCASTVAGTNERISIMGDTMTSERDKMRSAMTIVLNGKTYPVVLDTGIFEHNNANNGNLAAGQFASSIYFVPLTIQQNFPVTYVEYLDYRQASGDAALLTGRQDWWWTDGGSFSWAIEQQAWCYKLLLKTERRVVLRSPHLAGKLDYVMYSPLQHTRESDPDSPYHFDGGLSIRNPGTDYAVWL